MRSRTLLATLAAALGLAAGAAPASAATDVFLNELHYDNAGADTGEAVEIAGPAGTDLAGWSVVLYNGNDGADYRTLPLSGTIPAGRVLAFPAVGIQNGDPDGLALVDAAGTVRQFLSYDGAFTATRGPAQGRASTDVGVGEPSTTPAGQSLQLRGSGTTDADFTWAGPAVASFGQLNEGQTLGDAGPPPPPPAPSASCGAPATAIGAVQGPGAASPLQGRQVAVEGVVVGDVQEGLNGVFVQDPAGDGDAATSDGLFVFGVRADVGAGDAIRAVGTVTEFGGLTELTDVSAVAVCREDAGLPAAAQLRLPAGDEERERLEGMRVRVAQVLAVTETRDLDDFGEVLLAAGGPLRTPTEVAEPGEAARAVDAENDRRSLLLDDASSRSNPNPVPYVTPQDSLRRGDTTAGLEGVLSQGFGAYRLQPTEAVTFAEANPRPARPADVGGEVRVGSFNVLNFFVTQGGAQDRGAPDAEEFAQQRAKVVAAINGLGADVVALQEVQNTARRGLGADAALDALVAALNEDAGGPVWAAVPTPRGFAEDDEIRVAQIYRPREVKLVGEAVAFTGPAFEAAFQNARQPMAQTYRDGRETFTVIANHLKSKGCGGATGENRDQGDGQGCYTADRVEQARALLGFVAERQAASGDEDVLVLGDLNSYTREDPIDVLVGGGLVNVLAERVPDERRYSYVFDGAQGVLDHALATPSLARKVTGATEWHVNADEPELFVYDADEPDSGREAPGADAHLAAFYAPDPYRSSDHDALLLGLNTRGRPSP